MKRIVSGCCFGPAERLHIGSYAETPEDSAGMRR